MTAEEKSSAGSLSSVLGLQGCHVCIQLRDTMPSRLMQHAQTVTQVLKGLLLCMQPPTAMPSRQQQQQHISAGRRPTRLLITSQQTRVDRPWWTGTASAPSRAGWCHSPGWTLQTGSFHLW